MFRGLGFRGFRGLGVWGFRGLGLGFRGLGLGTGGQHAARDRATLARGGGQGGQLACAGPRKTRLPMLGPVLFLENRPDKTSKETS